MNTDKLFLMIKPDDGPCAGKVLFHEIEGGGDYSYGHKSLLIVDPSAIETLSREEVIASSKGEDFAG